jgi:hypothetical protein
MAKLITRTWTAKEPTGNRLKDVAQTTTGR